MLTELNEGIDGIASLKTMLDTDPETIRNVCDMTEARFNELTGLINESLDAFTEFGGITNEAAGVLECSRINGIFVDFYHDALCTNAPYSLMWVFATMMSVYILGMTIILFRGALLPTEKMYDGNGGESKVHGQMCTAMVGIVDQNKIVGWVVDCGQSGGIDDHGHRAKVPNAFQDVILSVSC